MTNIESCTPSKQSYLYLKSLGQRRLDIKPLHQDHDQRRALFFAPLFLHKPLNEPQ